MATNGIKFSTNYGKIICLFSQEIWLLLLYFEGNFLEKKRSAHFCEASVQKDFFVIVAQKWYIPKLLNVG